MRPLHSYAIGGSAVFALLCSTLSIRAQSPTPAAHLEVEWKASPRPAELGHFITTVSTPSSKVEVVKTGAPGEVENIPFPTLPDPASNAPAVINPRLISPLNVYPTVPAPRNASTAIRDSGVSYRPAEIAFPQSQPASTSSMIWGSAEYLHWFMRGNYLPALVTSAPAGGLGTLDNPQTQTVLGNGSATRNNIDGLRFRAGLWLDQCQTCGFEASFFRFGQNNRSYTFGSAGDPGFFRPFFNTNTGAPDAEVVSLQLPNAAGTGFDPILTGRVTVSSSTGFAGWDANFRKQLWNDPCGGTRFDLLFGYRYLRLRDVTSIREDLTSTDPQEVSAPLGTNIIVYDRFETINTFHGGQIGIAGDKRWGRWNVGFRSTVALGSTQQRVNIDGSTQVITAEGASSTSRGGLLALPSNIGSHTLNRFSVVPEASANIGYQVTDRIRLFGGYSFMYWTNVLRSAGQIDLAVNPTQLPNSTDPRIGPNRPVFQPHETGFWAHGVNLGVEYRW